MTRRSNIAGFSLQLLSGQPIIGGRICAGVARENVMNDFIIMSLPPERWRDAKALRLEALQLEPQAFASSYAEEAAFADEVWRARLQTAYERDGNLSYFAEREGALVGMAGATWSHRAKLRHAAFVYSVYVSPALRGHGIASALMRTLLDELADGLGFEKVSLTVNCDCLAAIRLYQKLGFEIVGAARRELKIAGRYYDTHFMERHFERALDGR